MNTHTPTHTAIKGQPVGATRNYKSRKHEGRGKIVETYAGETGLWVTLHDKVRGVNVTVRPSQLSKPAK